MAVHLEIAVLYFGLAVESVEEPRQLVVLERLGWTASVVQTSIPVMPLARDGWVEASAGY